MIGFNCQKCGKAYKVEQRLAGKRAACKACGVVNTIPPANNADIEIGFRDDGATNPRPAAAPAVPRPAPAAAAPVRPPAAPPPRGPVSAPLRVPPGGPAAGAPRACPTCGAPLGAGETFCTRCGFDFRTGRRAVTEVLAEAAPPPVYTPPAPSRYAGRGSDTGDGGGAWGGGGNVGAGWRRMAIWFIIWGIGSSLLPLIGVQFKVMAVFGAYAPLVGAVLGLVGAIILFADGSPALGAVGGVGTVISLCVFASVGTRQIRESDEREAAAKVKAPVADNGPAPALPALPATPWPRRPGFPAPSAPAAAPASTDFYVDGRPKISVTGPGFGIFGGVVRYDYVAVPTGQDPIAFYRPGLRHTDPVIRFAAVKLIVKHATDKAAGAAAAAELLRDSDPNVRNAAVEAQAIDHNPATVSALVGALTDAEVQIRRTAIRTLALYRDDAAIDPLAAHLADDPDAVTTALNAYPESSREKVTRAYASLLSRGDAKVRARALDAVLTRDPAGAAALLLPLTADPDAGLRQTAIAKLADLKHEPAIPKIADRLRDDHHAAVAALILFGKAAETAAIAKAAETDVPVRLGALEVLAEVGTAECLPAVRLAANADDSAVSAAARAIWKRLAPAESGPVDLALLDLVATDAKRQARAMTDLAATKPDDRKALVGRKIFDLLIAPASQPPLPDLAAQALRTWANQDVKDALLALLKPEVDPISRGRAIPVLADLRDPRMIAPLCTCIERGHNVPEADAALRQFGPAAEDDLMKLLRSTNVAAATKALDLLEAVGTKKCLPLLAQLAMANRGAAGAQARNAAQTINKRMAGK